MSFDRIGPFNSQQQQQQQQQSSSQMTPDFNTPLSQYSSVESSGNARMPYRTGIGERRGDNQPKVYSEIPSFPSFNEELPESASLEEICMRYPNHIRGKYLDAFIQWHWTANDIFSKLHPTAIKEFREYGIATCKTYNNRANFIFKRLDTRLKQMTAEKVKHLCLAPKIRPSMMDGTQRYGASKLRGKFHNPHALEVRTLLRRNFRKEPKEQPPAPEVPLWESRESFEAYKTGLAQHWFNQWGYADLIIDADAHLFNTPILQRKALILQVVQLPVTHAMQTLFDFPKAEMCPAFVEAIINKMKAIVTDMVVSDSSTAPGYVPGSMYLPERLTMARQYALSVIMAEQQAISAKLCELSTGLADMRHGGQKVIGLVHQAIKATAGLLGNVATSTVPTPKRAIQELPIDGAIPKRLKVENQNVMLLLQQPLTNDFDKELDVCDDLLFQQTCERLVPGWSSQELRLWLDTVSPGSPAPTTQVTAQPTSGDLAYSRMAFEGSSLPNELANIDEDAWPQYILDEVETAQSPLGGDGAMREMQDSHPRLADPPQHLNQQFQFDMDFMIDFLPTPTPEIMDSDSDWLRMFDQYDN